MYLTGTAVPQDEVEAAKWYRLAAEQGYAKAQFKLGVLYDFGKGVAADDAEAVRWYRLAATQGHATAQNNLGAMYAEGQGTPRDNVQALMWFTLAQKGGDPHAADSIDALTRAMTPEEIAAATQQAATFPTACRRRVKISAAAPDLCARMLIAAERPPGTSPPCC